MLISAEKHQGVVEVGEEVADAIKKEFKKTLMDNRASSPAEISLSAFSEEPHDQIFYRMLKKYGPGK